MGHSAIGSDADAGQTRTPVPQSLFELEFLRAGSLSPDARHVVYCLSQIEGQEKTELQALNLASGARRAFPPLPNAHSPAWSPDGHCVAFISSGRLCVADWPTLTVSSPLTPAHLTARGPLSWSPDSERIAVTLIERKALPGIHQVTRSHYRADGLGFLESLVSQKIYDVNRIEGSVRCLTPSESYCTQPEWSPCGRHVLFVAADDAVPYGIGRQRLLSASVASGELTQVLDRHWYVERARWVPGGERIVFSGARESSLTIPSLSLWVVGRDGIGANNRSEGLIGNIGSRVNHDMPARDLLGENVICIVDQRTALASVQIGGRVEVWSFALEGRPAMKAVVSGPRTCVVLGSSAAADTLLYASSDLLSPTDLWRAQLDGRRPQQITQLNARTISRWPERRIEEFRVVSEDGTEIEAWFSGPASARGPAPGALFIHAGPFAATGHGFRFDFLLLNAQGYGVTFANFRGSAGYGDSFGRLIMGDWGGKGFPDHMATVDESIRRGYLDENRLGVWGPSHGGFAACWIVGHSHRFKAAVAQSAFTHFSTLYYRTDVPEIFASDLGGRPHEMPAVYEACSPLTFAHQCRTPTMLVHGEDDLRCPIGEAEQFYRALQDVGCASELVRVPGCSHVGNMNGPPEARLAYPESLLRWFQRYL